MTYEELRTEFSKASFREKLIKELGSTCVNCSANNNIQYHHIVPLINGGTNKLSNIVPLCIECHDKAHDKKNFKSRNGGRPKAATLEEAEPILKKYFDLEIGAKESKILIGLSPKTKSTWSNLLNKYKEKHNIDKNFKNTIDILNIQEQRQETRQKNENKNK